MQDELNEALILFLGFGDAPSPRQDRHRLIQQFGDIKGPQLESEVVRLLEELGTIPVDWSAHTLVSAGEMARNYMRVHHPRLSVDALRALEWKFTFDWR